MTRLGWLLRAFGALPGPTRPPGTPRPQPLERPRVASYLRSRGYHFAVDEDGDFTGTWDEHRFWFLLLGHQQEIVQVRGRWVRTVPVEQRSTLLLELNDWNRERIWPKCYAREEDGRLAVYTEVSVDLEPGTTDDQLAQVLACGLGTGIRLFAALDERLPGEDQPPTDIPDD